MKSKRERIEQLIREALDPVELEVIDESSQHHGHAGARPGGETHYRVRIKADAFRGLTLLQQHKRVYAALGDVLRSEIHALALETAEPS